MALCKICEKEINDIFTYCSMECATKSQEFIDIRRTLIELTEQLDEKTRTKKPIIQRYKGLGEMNAEELGETTMDPTKRVLKQVTIDDIVETDLVIDVLMGNDVPSFLGTVNEKENRSKISVSADTKEEADKIFNTLSVGAEVEMPMADSPWGTYFGMFRDKYGIEWMIEFSAK